MISFCSNLSLLTGDNDFFSNNLDVCMGWEGNLEHNIMANYNSLRCCGISRIEDKNTKDKTVDFCS